MFVCGGVEMSRDAGYQLVIDIHILRKMTTPFKNSKRLFQNASKAEVVSCQGLSTPDASGRCPEMQKRSICTARKDT